MCAGTLSPRLRSCCKCWGLQIVETVVGFSYALINLKGLALFERMFFLVSGSDEMFGEVLVLFLTVGRMLELDNAAGALILASDYAKTSMHSRFFPMTSGGGTRRRPLRWFTYGRFPNFLATPQLVTDLAHHGVRCRFREPRR